MNTDVFLVILISAGFLCACLLIMTWFDIRTEIPALRNRELEKTQWFAVSGLCVCILVFGTFLGLAVSKTPTTPTPLYIVVTATPEGGKQ